MPGLDLPSLLPGPFPPDVLSRYDLIGMDSRGVGIARRSAAAWLRTLLDLLLPYPAPDGSIARNIGFARQFESERILAWSSSRAMAA